LDLDYPASGRFGTALAPAPLVLSQELANTIGFDHLPGVLDLFDQVDTAQDWIDAVVPQWCASFAAHDPQLMITEAELPRLRALRDILRSTIGEPSGSRIDVAIAGSAAVTVTRAGAHLEPLKPWRVMVVGGDRHRSCGCTRRMRVTATCGNQANVRAHRARRRQQ
jgi:hypothetical protein